jgi:hypothetical protein
MAHTIRFNLGEGELLFDQMKAVARNEGWAGTPGLKEWAKINYRAKLREGVVGITSINFKTENDMTRFRSTFC